jgi:predicted  nucleic acid-binding Zn ribbon protein
MPTPKQDICPCKTAPPIKLMQALTWNPIHCMVCNREVQRLKLPNRLISRIVFWRNLYDSIDRLWLASGEYEEWARNQLLNIESPINRIGLEVANELLKINVTYYWYFQDQAEDGFQPLRFCPICNLELQIYEGGVVTQLVCKLCHIVTAGT